jgi:hypothetical protein
MSRTEVRDCAQPERNARPGAGSATHATKFPDCHTPPRPDDGPVAALKGPRTTRGAVQRRSAPAGPVP